MTKLIVICRTCNGAGIVRNIGFEACKYDQDVQEGECDACPWKDRCDDGEFETCTDCDGKGVMIFSSERWTWKEEA